MSRLTAPLDGGDLAPAELRAMRLDGQVFALVDAWCPVDVVETPEVRARAVLIGRSTRLVAELRTAAWIWGALPALPRPVELCADVRARARVRPGTDASVRELVLHDEDVVRFGDAAVTSPLRTLVDLARAGTVDDDVLRLIARLGSVRIDDVRSLLAARALPGRRMALSTAERALP
jgi:hypothetical protein